jgi:hypothetical protein
VQMNKREEDLGKIKKYIFIISGILSILFSILEFYSFLFIENMFLFHNIIASMVGGLLIFISILLFLKKHGNNEIHYYVIMIGTCMVFLHIGKIIFGVCR